MCSLVPKYGNVLCYLHHLWKSLALTGLEPVLAWLTVSMPTGSGKSTLFRHLYSVMRNICVICGVCNEEPTWVFDDATFEKMGVLMSENSSRLLGFYDEISAFLTQINLYRGWGLPDSHELSLFLQLITHIRGGGTQVSHLIRLCWNTSFNRVHVCRICTFQAETGFMACKYRCSPYCDLVVHQK